MVIPCEVFWANLSFFQILVLYDSLETIDVDKVVQYISGLQQEDGSFYGDKWGQCICIRVFMIYHIKEIIQNIYISTITGIC